MNAVGPWFGRIWSRLRRLFTRPLDDVVVIDGDDPPVCEQVEEPKPSPLLRVGRRRDPERQGETTWHLKTTILDRLDEYFGCMRRLQIHDSDSYDLFSRIGFAIPADVFVNPEHDAWKARLAVAPRRAFGGILCGGLAAPEIAKDYSDSDRFVPSFVYFMKVRRPSRVEPSIVGETIYSLTALYDDRDAARAWSAKLTVPVACHVALSPAGDVRLLRELTTTRTPIYTGRKTGRRREIVSLSCPCWKYPSWLYELFDSTINEKSVKTPEQFARELFLMAFLTYDNAISRIIIRASRNHTVAAFGIDLPRAKYFFADRQIDSVAADGRKKRIFHSVVEHDRQIAPDRTTRVRYHYRGIRDFTWNGNGVHIVLPTKTFALDMPIASTYTDDIDPNRRDQYEGTAKAGSIIGKVLSS